MSPSVPLLIGGIARRLTALDVIRMLESVAALAPCQIEADDPRGDRAGQPRGAASASADRGLRRGLVGNNVARQIEHSLRMWAFLAGQ